MSSIVVSQDMSKPIVRRKMVQATNDTSMKTTVNCNEFGKLVFDSFLMFLPAQEGAVEPCKDAPPNIFQIGPQEPEKWAKHRNQVNEY